LVKGEFLHGVEALFGHFFDLLAGPLKPASGGFAGSLQAAPGGLCGPPDASLGGAHGALDASTGGAHRAVNAASGGFCGTLNASPSCLTGMAGTLLDPGQRLASGQRNENGCGHEGKVLHERLLFLR